MGTLLAGGSLVWNGNGVGLRPAVSPGRLVFPLRPKHVHASSIVECPDGSLLCAWFHGSGERTSPDVVIQGARLKERKHRPGAQVFSMADTPNLPDCNPVLFVGPGRGLWLFWIAVPAERWEDSLLRFRKAREYGGEGPPKWDWQDDLLLEPGDRFATEMAEKFHQLRPTSARAERSAGPIAGRSHGAAAIGGLGQEQASARLDDPLPSGGVAQRPDPAAALFGWIPGLSHGHLRRSGKIMARSGAIIGPALQPSVVRRRTARSWRTCRGGL